MPLWFARVVLCLRTAHTTQRAAPAKRVSDISARHSIRPHRPHARMTLRGGRPFVANVSFPPQVHRWRSGCGMPMRASLLNLTLPDSVSMAVVANGAHHEVATVDSDPFRLAAFGILDVLRKLLATGAADVNAKDDKGCAPLIWACRNGHEPVVDFLIEKGADLETQSFGGLRPLHHACNNSRESIIAKLLSSGANPNSVDHIGNTPLHYCCARGMLNIVIALLDSRGDPSAANASGSHPIHKAAIYGNAAVVKKLVESGVDVNVTDKEGNTALHISAKAGFVPTCSMLLQLGARMDLANRDGRKAVDVAVDGATKQLFKK